MSNAPELKKRGLGRGLDALFGDDEPSNERSHDADSLQRRTLPVSWLKPGRLQPRKHFDAESLKELAASIEQHGVMQPLVVRPVTDEDNTYEIVAGERRWRAAQRAQLHQLPVVIQYLTDEQVLELGLIENIQREDLNPVEEAIAFQKLIEEFGHTQDKLAQTIGKSRSHIANTMRLLSLPKEVQDYVASGRMSAGHARTLINAENPLEVAKQILEGALSVREAENLAAQNRDKPLKKAKSKPKSVDLLSLEKEISDSLGLKTVLSGSQKKGKITIHYSSLDQLDDVLERLAQSN